MSGSPTAAGNDTPGILYISYDGMLEPLGQSQVLAYLERLSAGRRIHLISFEKPHDLADTVRREAMRKRLQVADICWHRMRYHKAPTVPATAYDIAVGAAKAIKLVRSHSLGLVHARSYVAALMALAVKRATGAAFLFDMRGLWADERVDGGLWPAGGLLYRVAKALERHLLTAADQVVTLTHASSREIARIGDFVDQTPPIRVIPTCADLHRFTTQGPPPAPFVLGYVGSVGTWYLLDEMLHCFRLLRREVPDARLLIVNRDEQEMIRERANAIGVDTRAMEITAAEHRDMPSQISRMSAAMALIKPSYSKIASAPTKLGEYLGCGVPCLGNVGVGDMEAILTGRKVGVAIAELGQEGLEEGIVKLVKLTTERGIRERCRTVALDLFSVDSGVAAYGEIYKSIAGERARSA